MAMFAESQDPLGPTTETESPITPVQPAFTPQPTSWQTVGAAMQDNSVYAGVSALGHVLQTATMPPDPNYNVMGEIKGTPWETNYLTSFLGSQSAAETASIKARITDQEQQRQILAASGWAGTAVQIATGLLEPTNYLPILGEELGAARAVEGAVAATKSGATIARTLSWAKTGAVGAAINEGVLQTSQDGRTAGDAVQNIASGTIMMGLLGAAHATLFPHEVEAATSGIEAARQDYKPGTPAETIDPNAIWPSSGPAPGGAAVSDARPMVQKPFAPVPQSWRDASPIIDKIASGFESANNALSPLGRLFSSESVTARRATADLAETVRGFDQNVAKPLVDDAGKPILDDAGNQAFSEPMTTTREGLPPVDRQADMLKKTYRTLTNDALNSTYADYRYAGNTPALVGAREAMEEIRGKTNDGKLTFSDYKTEVSKALYSGDQHDIPQVQQAAQEIRQKVLDPIKERAQSTKGSDGTPMMSEGDLFPKGDQSFFPRTWDRVKVAAKRTEFVRKVADWLESEQAKKAATQDRISTIAAKRDTVIAQLKKIESRQATNARRQAESAAQLKERTVELNGADKRSDTLADRQAETSHNLSEVEEFVSTMKGQASSPEMQAQIKELSDRAVELRAAERRSGANQSSFADQDREEVAGTFGDGDFRKAAEVYVGKRNLPKSRDFLQYLKDGGGVVGEPDEKEALKDARRPGLIRKDRKSIPGIDGKGVVRDADDWGEKLAEDFPHAFPNGRPDRTEVLGMMRDAASGKDPWFMHTDERGAPDEASRIAGHVNYLDDLFRHLGVTAPDDMHELAATLAGHRAVSAEDIERALKEQEAAKDLPSSDKLHDMARSINEDKGRTAEDLEHESHEQAEVGADIPPAARRMAAESMLNAQLEARQHIRDLATRGRTEADALDKQRVRTGIRESEAGVAVNRSESRFEQLKERERQQQISADLLDAARENAQKMHDDLTAKLEDEVRGWQGKSSAEAIKALAARDEAERVRSLKMDAGVYEGKGKRLTSADSAVNTAIKNISDSDRNLSRQELESRAHETADRILSSPDGRLNYENGGMGPDHGGSGDQVRSSLNKRAFAIPTHLVADFVNHDTEHAIQSLLRGVIPDILLTDRFGDTAMESVMRKVNEDYAKLGEGASEKRARALEARRQNDIRDIAAIRDRVKGVYGWSPDPRLRQAARVAGVFRNWNALADLGTSVVNRMGDLTGGVFRFGFDGMFKNAWAPYFRGLTGMSKEDFVGAARRQAKAMHIGVEGHLGHMSHTISDALDSYQPGSKFERTLGVAADRSMLINMHSQWTDEVKMMTTPAAAAEFLHIAERISNGTATAKEAERMASANITSDRARQIWGEYSKDGGGQKIDGVHMPNTAAWDPMARQSFESAMAREVDAVVLTSGQEKPLWLSHPILGLIGQFKGFTSAAHEKILIANLQQRDARTLQGLFASVAMGMVSYRLYTLLAGQQASDRPQDWIKEGISRSAVSGWITDMNAMQARFTGGKTDLYRAIGADRPLSRHDQRSALSELLGPTYSRLEGLANAVGDASMTKPNGQTEWNATDTHKIRQMAWMQNIFFLRQLLDKAEDGINNSLGIKPLDRTPKAFVKPAN